MARRLLWLGALIGLALLIRASPGLPSVIYEMPAGVGQGYPGPWLGAPGDNSVPVPLPLYSLPGPSYPGLSNGSFYEGLAKTDQNGVTWTFGHVSHAAAGQFTIPLMDGSGNYWSTLRVIYSMNNFFVSGGLDISSTESMLTTAATIHTDDAGRLIWINRNADHQDNWGYRLWNKTMTMTGYGSNSSDGISFSVAATMHGVMGGNPHEGYFANFTLVYGSGDPGASAVPIPGAIWLLGTGLLGLGCVWRRRSS